MSRSTTIRPTRASSAGSAALLIGLVLLAGCAGYGPGSLRPGASEAEVRSVMMGSPSDSGSLPGGGRWLDYARGPMGKHTFRLEFDAAGRYTGARQLLTDAAFEALPPGAAAAEVRNRLGKPSETRVGWRGVGEVWSYRYEPPPPYCRWFQVWLVDGKVREAGYAPDPICEDKGDRDRDFIP
jgi:hypothetical protein